MSRALEERSGAVRPARPLYTWASDRFAVPLPAAHPFPSPKYPALRERLVAEEILSPAEIRPSEPAPVAWLALVHEEGYLARALEGTLSPEERRRLGIPWSPELVLRARATLFGTVMAARAALVEGVAGNLAGGTHHAFRDRGEGYCLFNDLAAAIEGLRVEGLVGRVAIVDLDVHQGNGTAAIFADDESVFTFSMHAGRNYPVQKERSDLDVELPDGCEDATYLALLDEHLPEVLERARPDLVLFQAGVDGLAEDRLGRLGLTHAGLAARDERVFGACEERGLPVAFVLGGGYARPVEASIEAHRNVWRAARRLRDRIPVRSA